MIPLDMFGSESVAAETMYRPVEHFARALDAPSLDIVGPVAIDEVYVPAGKKGRERDRGVTFAWPVYARPGVA